MVLNERECVQLKKGSNYVCMFFFVLFINKKNSFQFTSTAPTRKKKQHTHTQAICTAFIDKKSAVQQQQQQHHRI